MLPAAAVAAFSVEAKDSLTFDAVFFTPSSAPAASFDSFAALAVSLLKFVTARISLSLTREVKAFPNLV